jgi:hypothetical protein
MLLDADSVIRGRGHYLPESRDIRTCYIVFRVHRTRSTGEPGARANPEHWVGGEKLEFLNFDRNSKRLPR